MMKSLCVFGLLAGMGMLLCVGCVKIQNTAGDAAGTSGGAVTGQTVTGVVAAGQTKRKSPGIEDGDLYANSTHVYREYKDEEYESNPAKGIIQYTKSGEKQRTYKMKDFEGLLAVTEKEIYFAGGKDDDTPSRLCRIPISKGKGGAELQTDKTEVIFTDKGGIQHDDDKFYIDEDYIVYISYGDYIVKYNRKTEKKVQIPVDNNSNHIETACQRGLIITNDNTDEVYLLDLHKDKLVSIIPPSEYTRWDFMTAGDGNLFHCNLDFSGKDGNGIWVYQGDSGKNRLLVSERRIKEAVDGLAVPDNPCHIGKPVAKTVWAWSGATFYQDDKLYITFQIDWAADKKCWGQNIIFSVDMLKWDGKETSLHYEKELTDVLSRESDSRAYHLMEGDVPVNDEEVYEWNPSQILGIEGKKAILNLYRKKEKCGEFIYYDLDTGKYYRIEKDKSREYLYLFYNHKPSLGKEDYLMDGFLTLVPDYLEYE